MVFKPSELTPLTASKLGEILTRPAPPGVFNVVQGGGRSRGPCSSAIRASDKVS